MDDFFGTFFSTFFDAFFTIEVTRETILLFPGYSTVRAS